MPEPHLSNPRKRQHSEQRPVQPNGTSQPLSKRRKVSHPTIGSPPPAAFWDNLSKIWLTDRALRELDRRNTQASSSPLRSPGRRLHRPVTRRALAEWKEIKRSWQPVQPAADFLSHCTPRCLEHIKLFARRGGPDLSDLRGYRKPVSPLYRTMSSSRSSSLARKRLSTTTSSTKPTTKTTTTRKSRPYDRDFQQNLVDGGVYTHGYRYPDGRVPAKPNNWEEINKKLAQPRPSLSPSKFSEEAHEQFVQADVDASKEKQVTDSVIPIIEGKIEDTKCRSGGIPFTNLDHLTDGTLVPGNPDIYYGARPEQLSRKVRDELDGQIIPSTQHDLPMAPNFFLAAKGPDGSAAVAKRQACYDGALGARGMHSLRSYRKDEPVYDNNAYTISSIYHNGQLQMYTSHPSKPASPRSRPEYYMTQLRTFAMTDTAETFRRGATAYRNARDWAKEQSDEAINQANEIANGVEAEAPADDASGASPASSFVTAASDTEAYTMSQQTSFNEDSNAQGNSEESDSSIEDYRLPAKRSSQRPERPQTQRKRRNADVTTEQSERWSWRNGKFQCFKGQDLMKEQNDTPADVWIYFDEGWPSQEGKKWRLWISATREILYS